MSAMSPRARYTSAASKLASAPPFNAIPTSDFARGRGVVDTVADHDDEFMALFRFGDRRDLALRRGSPFACFGADPDRRGNAHGDPRIVSRQKRAIESELRQATDQRGSVRSGRISETTSCNDAFVHGDFDRGKAGLDEP
jgi:hypothetical protein